MQLTVILSLQSRAKIVRLPLMQEALRILKPGQRANIWLELRMPEVNGDVFQVLSWQRLIWSIRCYTVLALVV